MNNTKLLKVLREAKLSNPNIPGINDAVAELELRENALMLTEAERERVVKYLDADIASTRELVKQMENLPLLLGHAMQRRYTAEVAAISFVADKLRFTETQTITGATG